MNVIEHGENSPYELKVVNIRLVEAPSLYSDVPIQGPEAAIEVMGNELRQYDREVLCVLNLNNRNKVINMNIVSIGTVNASLVRPAEVFKSAILSNATNIMVMHNHPSGDCTPSGLDVSVTDKLINVGLMIGIPVLDHIIVSDKDYYSFKSHGLMDTKKTEEPKKNQKQAEKDKVPKKQPRKLRI